MTTYRWNVSEAAEGYDQAAELIHPHYIEIQDAILSAIPLEPDASFVLIDAGGGSGRLAERVLDSFPKSRVIVFDQSEAFLALAERRLQRFGDRAEVYVCRLQDDWVARVPTPADVIVSMSAIHHLDTTEKQALYAECNRALTPRGLFMNGDEVRPADDASYRDELEQWARHMRDLIAANQLPMTMPPMLEGWIDRNVVRFGEPKSSGDDCHETAQIQLEYLARAGFSEARVLWKKQLWAILHATRAPAA